MLKINLIYKNIIRQFFSMLNSILVNMAFILIRIYQIVLSPYLGRNCRFSPTCSVYTIEALKSHGFLKGSYLGITRILRCNPFFKHGFDPVPKGKINK